MITFPISCVETYWWLPIVVALAISSFTSTGGVSGAFLLLPFQISILGFTGPAVSSTNFIYNIVAIPSGVYRYYREKRMVWPLTWTVVAGTLPGVFIGAFIRVNYLPDPRNFKLFAGLVLLYLGVRLLIDLLSKAKKPSPTPPADVKFEVTEAFLKLTRLGYVFNGERFQASTLGIAAVSFIVGTIAGTYGIGGGAMMAPLLVAMFRLPVHTIAGAALLGTFITSIAGVLFYTFIAPFYAGSGLAIAPDWMLGGMFGVGGALGMYIGARLQRYLSARVIKAILSFVILFVAIKYIWQFFF